MSRTAGAYSRLIVGSARLARPCRSVVRLRFACLAGGLVVLPGAGSGRHRPALPFGCGVRDGLCGHVGGPVRVLPGFLSHGQGGEARQRRLGAPSLRRCPCGHRAAPAAALAAFFPGSLPWDAVRSMNQFITAAPLENHHPVMMNALYAALMTLGRSVRSDNFGLFMIVAFQYVVCVVVDLQP